ncbi:uncharacterized protein LOC127810473 [Diospyros lotus]|uniref:uncharacterized protein LOC127810473 n=1 Tax=Diospyros lotus TaxID=55363 RepID=UPI00225B70F5|nr:uncharacterized protein LOC127810473 [Diospyros lotus]
MSSEEEKKCPLCAEEMDWTDQQLKPCRCGYEVCVWCWHHIMDMADKDETEGRCPACRTPYDKEKIVGMEANCERMASTMKDRKGKPQKVKPRKSEVKDLSSVRVIQRKMAYVIGLPLSLADEDLLQRKEYFGQYGKVSKVSLSRTTGGAVQQFVNDTCSVYITYSKEEEAIRCIQSVHGFVLEGRLLRASFGTAKYCHAWLRNVPCTNPTCLYLHSIGAEEDSFGKDEEAAVHTRNRVHQIVGATHDMQQRSGNMLPPPLDDPFNSSGVPTDTVIVRSAHKETTHATVSPTGKMTCSLSTKDKDGDIKAPNRTFVDIVGRSSSGPEKVGNVAEDGKILNLCSDFSSETIDRGKHVDGRSSNSMLYKFSSSSYSPIGVTRDKDSQGYSIRSFGKHSKFSIFPRADFTHSDACIAEDQSHLIFDSQRQVLPNSCCDGREDLPSVDDQRSNGSDCLIQGSSVFPSSDVDQSPIRNHVDKASIPFKCVNSVLMDGCDDRKSDSSTESEEILRCSNFFYTEDIVEQLRRLDDDNVTNDDDRSAVDVVESSIISNILSLDFDSCDKSLTFHELLEGTGGCHGTWNFRNGDESRFSFAKEENSSNQATVLDYPANKMDQVSENYSYLLDSMKNDDHYLHGPHLCVSRSLSSTPQGFSMPSKEPPGFSGCERTHPVLSATSGTPLVKTSSSPNNQHRALSAGNVNNTPNLDFIDPAILVVGAKGTTVLNNSGLETRPTCTSQPTMYDDEAKLWLLMQEPVSAHHNPKFPMQETPSAHRELSFSGFLGNGFSVMSDRFDLSSRLMEQCQMYNPSLFTPLSKQKYGSGCISNGGGCWPHLDEVQLQVRNEVGMAEIQRNERLGFNKVFPGYGVQMPGSGMLYTI